MLWRCIRMKPLTKFSTCLILRSSPCHLLSTSTSHQLHSHLIRDCSIDPWWILFQVCLKPSNPQCILHLVILLASSMQQWLSSAAAEDFMMNVSPLSFTWEKIWTGIGRSHPTEAEGSNGVSYTYWRNVQPTCQSPSRCCSDRILVSWKTSYLVPVPKAAKPAQQTGGINTAAFISHHETLEQMTLQHLKLQVIKDQGLFQFEHWENLGLCTAIWVVHFWWFFKDIWQNESLHSKDKLFRTVVAPL